MEFSNGLLVPIITKNLKALLALVKMSSCGCRKECIRANANFLKTVLSASVDVKTGKKKEVEKDIFYNESDNDD